MLRNNRISRLQENVFIYLETKPETQTRKLFNPDFCEKLEVTRVPLERLSRTTGGMRTISWESLACFDQRKQIIFSREYRITKESLALGSKSSMNQ